MPHFYREDLDARKWLSENDPKKKQPQNCRPKANPYCRRYPREIIEGRRLETVKRFIEKSRYHKGAECLFVPGSRPNVKVTVRHCGNTIPAARYMLLLTVGTPTSDGMVARHLCGNGHLNCVNPAHLAWGAPSDNISDMVKHRDLENASDRLNAVTPNL